MLCVAANRADLKHRRGGELDSQMLGSAGLSSTRAPGCHARDSRANNHHFQDDPAFQAAIRVASRPVPVPIRKWSGAYPWLCGPPAPRGSRAISSNAASMALSQYPPDEIDGGLRRVAQDAIAHGGCVMDLARVRANCAERPNVEHRAGPGARGAAVGRRRAGRLCAPPWELRLPGAGVLLGPPESGAMVLLDDSARFSCCALAEAIDAVAASPGAEVLSRPAWQGLIVR